MKNSANFLLEEMFITRPLLVQNIYHQVQNELDLMRVTPKVSGYP